MAAPTNMTDFPPGYLEEDHGPKVLAATTVILVFTTVLLGLRIYARSLTKAERGWDEFLLYPSYLLLVGLLICLYRKSNIYFLLSGRTTTSNYVLTSLPIIK